MADERQLASIREWSVHDWNQWRQRNEVEPDLSGADLSNRRLDAIDLSRANLNGADLRNTRLQGANLTAASLVGANLELVRARNARFTEASLSHARLVRADLSEASLERASLNDADLSSSVLTNAKLGSADLTLASLVDANLVGAALDDARMELAQCHRARMTRCSVVGAIAMESVAGLDDARFDRDHEPMEDGSQYLNVNRRNSVMNWAQLRVIGSFPLFSVSWSALLASVLLLNTLGWLNETKFIDDWIVYPVPIPRRMGWLIASSVLLVAGSTSYRIACPRRVQEFSEEQFVEELRQPRLLYLGASWNRKAAQ